MFDKCTRGSKVKEWRWDDITGHSSLSAVEVSIPMKWPFCTLLFCGWDPTLGDALDFHPFPNVAPATFQTPERDQLPTAPCQMTSSSCGYRTAAAFWTPLSVSWEETRNGLKTFFFFSLLLWRRTTYFSHAFFFSPVRAYFVLYCASVYVWIWVTFNESLVLSLRGFVSFCVCVVPPEGAENRFSLHLRGDNNCHLWL